MERTANWLSKNLRHLHIYTIMKARKSKKAKTIFRIEANGRKLLRGIMDDGCKCKGVEMGSYSNQVEMINWWNGGKIGIDGCIADEIQELWNNKIHTTGCCCGHNIEIGYINVIDNDIPRMLELDYEYYINEFGTHCFFLKSDKSKVIKL